MTKVAVFFPPFLLGHPLSWLRADVEFTAAAPVNATCSFVAVAVDYSSAPYVRQSETRAPNATASTAKTLAAQTVALKAGESPLPFHTHPPTCTFLEVGSGTTGE